LFCKQNSKPVEIATIDTAINCDVDVEGNGASKYLLNCILKELNSIVEELDEDEKESVSNFPYIGFKVHTQEQELTTKLIENPLYWKKKYLECQEKLRLLQSNQSTSQSTQSTSQLYEDYVKCKAEKAECEAKLKSLNDELARCKENLTKVEKRYDECEEAKKELVEALSELKLELKLMYSASGSKESSSALDKALEKLADSSPELAKEIVNTAKEVFKNIIEVEKLKTASTIAKHTAEAKKVEYEREKTKKSLLTFAMVAGQLLAPLFEEFNIGGREEQLVITEPESTEYLSAPQVKSHNESVPSGEIVIPRKKAKKKSL